MSQTWNPETYSRDAAFVPQLGSGVLEWLAPKAGERILDLGCGDGQLTEHIAAAGASVTGVDASPAMVAAARAALPPRKAPRSRCPARITPSTPCFRTQSCIGCEARTR